MDVQAIIEYIVDLLQADSQLTSSLGVTGVYDTEAPRQATWPFILVYDSGNSAIRGIGGTVIMTNALIGVRVVSATESAHSLVAIAQRFDDVLSVVSTSDSNLVTIDIARDSELKRAYTVDGRAFRELGGLYRCFGRKRSA